MIQQAYEKKKASKKPKKKKAAPKKKWSLNNKISINVNHWSIRFRVFLIHLRVREFHHLGARYHHLYRIVMPGDDPLRINQFEIQLESMVSLAGLNEFQFNLLHLMHHPNHKGHSILDTQ